MLQIFGCSINGMNDRKWLTMNMEMDMDSDMPWKWTWTSAWTQTQAWTHTWARTLVIDMDIGFRVTPSSQL